MKTKPSKPLSPKRAITHEIRTLTANRRKVLNDAITATRERKREEKAQETRVNAALHSIDSRRRRLQARLAALA